MTIPLSTNSYNHYAGADDLSVYPITFPTYEAATVSAYITNLADWSHIAGEVLSGLKVFDLVLGTDFSLQNIARPSTTLTLLDASAVPLGWVGPIPARQEWLESDGTLSTGYFLFIEFISNPMRPAVLSSGNQLVPALSKDLDRLTMHLKALDHRVYEGFKDLIQMSAGSGASGLLPTATDPGDYLEYDGADAIWQSGLFEGFSLRYGTFLSLASLRDALLYVLNFGYLAPTISLSCSPSQSLREKGTSVAAVTMSATTVKNTNPITAVTHYRNGVLVNTEAAPLVAGGVETFTESTPFTDTMSFYSKVNDGTSLVQSNTVTYSYAYPYYEGKGAAGLNAAGIVAGLTKVVRAATANVAVTASPTVEHFYFCYPAAYSALYSILDPNGFEIISGFTARLVNITGLDGTSQSYRVYELTNPTTQVAFTVTYKR